MPPDPDPNKSRAEEHVSSSDVPATQFMPLNESSSDDEDLEDQDDNGYELLPQEPFRDEAIAEESSSDSEPPLPGTSSISSPASSCQPIDHEWNQIGKLRLDEAAETARREAFPANDGR